jgi:adenylate cyclase
VILLQLSGILQPLQQMHYDFSFKIKPTEPQDRQIIIVDGEDKSNKDRNESLTLLLKKISAQNPKAVGLCLENEISAYYSKPQDQIGNSFSTNLPSGQTSFGIEQILLIENLPTLRSQEPYTTTSKVPVDSDFRIRRFSFLMNADKTSFVNSPDGSDTNTSRPYIGVALAVKFLLENNWIVEPTPQQVNILKWDREVILKPDQRSFNFLNLYQRDKSLGFLINWRKVKNTTPFKRVRADSVLNDRVPPDLFSNRLVIIGDSYDYGSKVLRTPLERWQEDRFTDNASVAAHVASSIINRVEKKRLLIKIAPWWVSFLILALIVYTLAYIANTKLQSAITLRELRSLFFLCGVTLIILCSCLGWILLLVLGLWFDVASTLIAIPWSLVLFYNFCQNAKEERDFHYLRLLLNDFKHNINNISHNISLANTANKLIVDDMLNLLKEDWEILGEDDLDQDPTGKNLKKLEIRFQRTNEQILRIKRYEERVTKFLKYTYSNKLSKIEEVELNKSIRNIVSSCFKKEKLDYVIQLDDVYDDSIETVWLYQEDLQILIENLVDNAITAVNPELNSDKSLIPLISVKTINYDKQVKIIIEDNGIGIPLSYQQDIFSPFFSLMNGQGIGLYLVYQIVNSLKGTLVLESEINEGSKFIISLPKKIHI